MTEDICECVWEGEIEVYQCEYCWLREEDLCSCKYDYINLNCRECF